MANLSMSRHQLFSPQDTRCAGGRKLEVMEVRKDYKQYRGFGNLGLFGIKLVSYLVFFGFNLLFSQVITWLVQEFFGGISRRKKNAVLGDFWLHDKDQHVFVCQELISQEDGRNGNPVILGPQQNLGGNFFQLLKDEGSDCNRCLMSMPYSYYVVFVSVFLFSVAYLCSNE